MLHSGWWCGRSIGGLFVLGYVICVCFFFQAEDGIRDLTVTGVQTCALPIARSGQPRGRSPARSSPDAFRAASGFREAARGPEVGSPAVPPVISDLDRKRLLLELRALQGATLQKLWLPSPQVCVLQLRVPGRSALAVIDARLRMAALAAGRPTAPA